MGQKLMEIHEKKIIKKGNDKYVLKPSILKLNQTEVWPWSFKRKQRFVTHTFAVSVGSI